MSDAAITPQVPQQDGTVIAETPQEKLTRRQRYVRNATEQLRRENEQLKAELAKRPAPAAEPEPEAAPKPKRADFAQDEAGEQAFEDALIGWSMQKTLSEKAATDAQASERQFFETNVKKYTAQIEAARKRYPDWEETVNQEVYIGHQSQLAIMELDNAAEVLYWLGKNPDRAAELGKLRPVSQIAAVGRLSEYLRLSGSSDDEPEYRRPSGPRPRVPAPVRTVNTGGAGPGPSFADVAARPDYPGKAADLKRLLREQR